ncbi:hypothetical protein [Vibrio sp. CK2-1]|nr:hypothetical protein [Vibrio sp. CK2-1]
MNIDNGSEPKNYEFGHWPEIVGVVITLGVLAFLFGYAEGML